MDKPATVEFREADVRYEFRLFHVRLGIIVTLQVDHAAQAVSIVSQLVREGWYINQVIARIDATEQINATIQNVLKARGGSDGGTGEQCPRSSDEAQE